MARVADDSGIPTVAPDITAPVPYQRFDVSPQTFGGNVAAELARTAQAVLPGVTQIADKYDKVAVDDALNQFQDRSRNILRAPGATSLGPDGQPTRQPGGYLSLSGSDALNARAKAQADLDQSLREIGGKLSGRQQGAFQEAARQYRQSALNQIDAHADQQYKVYTKSVNDASIRLAMDGIAARPDDGEAFDTHLKDAIKATIRNLENQGLSDDPAASMAAVRGTVRGAVRTRLDAIAMTDPARAYKMVMENRESLGADADELAARYRPRADQQVGAAAGTLAWRNASAAPSAAPGFLLEPTARLPKAAPGDLATPNGNLPAAPAKFLVGGDADNAPGRAVPTTGPSADQINSAIHQQESSGRNIPNPMQIQPDTWKQYAKPEENIDNPEDNLRVGKRITDEYFRKYNGDPARVAVAYFSGEGNVAPPGSPTPWVRDTADKTHKTVSSYVSDVARRLGMEPSASRGAVAVADSIDLRKANAIESVLNDPNLTDPQRDVAIAHIKTQAQVDTLRHQDAKQREDQANADFTSTLEIQVRRGQAFYSQIEDAYQNRQITPTKRVELTQMADTQAKEQTKITDAMARVTNALNGGAPLDPKSEYDKKALDVHYAGFAQSIARLPADEALPRAVNYTVQAGMAPTPVKQYIRSGLRGTDGNKAVEAASIVKTLRNANPQILNDFADEDLTLANLIGSYTDYGIPPADAVVRAQEAMKVTPAVRDARRHAFDLELGSDNKQREAKIKSWMGGKLNSMWTADPSADPIMMAEFENVARSQYERTGDIESSLLYALDVSNRVWGRTRVGGDLRYMKFAPEKFYEVPTMSPEANAAWMNEQLLENVSKGAFVDPMNPLTADRLRLTVDPTRTATDGRPVYLVAIKGIDGVYYDVTGADRRPLSWRPDWNTSAEKLRREQIYGYQIEDLRAARNRPTGTNPADISSFLRTRREQMLKLGEAADAVP